MQKCAAFLILLACVAFANDADASRMRRRPNAGSGAGAGNINGPGSGFGGSGGFTQALGWNTSAASATYALSAVDAVPSLNGQAHLACGFVYRPKTSAATQSFISYGGVSDRSWGVRNPIQVVINIRTSNGASEGWTDNISATVGQTRYLFFVFDGTGSGNSQRLQVGAQGVDRSALGTYAGTIPATTRATPTTPVLSLGALGNASTLQGTILSRMSCWIGTNAPTRLQFSAAMTAWYTPNFEPAPTTIAAAWGGSTPDIDFDLENTSASTGALTIGTMTETSGPFVYSGTNLVDLN